MTTKRVLFVDHVDRILGGAEVNVVELLATGLPREEWSVACACPPRSPLSAALAGLPVEQHAYTAPAALNQVRVVARPLAPWSLLRGWRAMSRARVVLAGIVRDYRPDAVISCANKDHFCAGPVCRRARVPSVWWVNDIVSTEFFSPPVVFAFRAQARRYARRLVVVSDFCRQALLRQRLRPELIVTIHNGIPGERYRRQASGSWRRQAGLPAEAPLIGLVGRFTPWKGQDFFLRLAEAWLGQGGAGHFVLVGQAFNEDQGYEAALRGFVPEHGLAGRVHFVPFQRDLAAVLSDLAVLVHTSLKPEPFGRVVIEAMAAGVPVIAARAGGVPEIIADGVNGRLVEPGNLGAYREALHQLFNAPETARQWARAGEQTVAERFSIGRVREQFVRLVAELG